MLEFKSFYEIINFLDNYESQKDFEKIQNYVHSLGVTISELTSSELMAKFASRLVSISYDFGKDNGKQFGITLEKISQSDKLKSEYNRGFVEGCKYAERMLEGEIY